MAGWIIISPPHAVQREVAEVGGTGECKLDLWELVWTRLLGIYQREEILKMYLWLDGASGASWPDGGGLLPQRERASR